MRIVNPYNLEDVARRREARERVAELKARQRGTLAPQLRPVATGDRSANPLRPSTFAEMRGQGTAKAIMQRVVERFKATGEPMDHILLVGGAGTGKSTLSHVIAHEAGVTVYEVQAPISLDTLRQLGDVMHDGDILRIEEIHLQAIQERRGKIAATQPEVLFALMEDRVLQTETGVQPYPAITIIGTTTDEGMLPDPFINRFPLRPHLAPYSFSDMRALAYDNACALGLQITDDATAMFARASRLVPRQVNNYVRNSQVLAEGDHVDDVVAYRVLREMNNVTLDGLTADMQNMLLFLWRHGGKLTKDGMIYQASVNTIATALGKARDTKAINLRVEPYLIERGLVQVAPRGRLLTDQGVERARELAQEGW